MTKKSQKKPSSNSKIIAISILGSLLLLSYFYLRAKIITPIGINQIRTGQASCLNTLFRGSNPISVPNNLTYPATLKANDGTHLLFLGGLTSQLPPEYRQNPARVRFPASQEEIWVSNSADGGATWSAPNFTFGITPETPVAFKGSQPYSVVYPKGFKKGCNNLPQGQCNVQINDPTAVNLNGTTYLYFTILENSRWFDGSLGAIKDDNPTNPDKQNIHSIGLAVSGDNGKNWAFVDKVIPEDAKDSSGQAILGAWAPSAIVVGNNVEIYFHDALGTKQYVATLSGGATLSQVKRLNPSDSTYRTNLDVIDLGTRKLVAYNDNQFNIVTTEFTSEADFGQLCPPKIVVPSSPNSIWPTPHITIKDNSLHLFFWQFQAPTFIHHWISSL